MSKQLRFIILTAVAAVLTVGWITYPAAQELNLVGTWVVTSDDTSHQRGALVFNNASYSMMLVNGDEPRALWDAPPTDADMVVAFRSITANSGRYTLEGDQLTWEAYMANNPNYMDGWPENDQTTTVSIDDDGILTATFFERTLKFRRVEDS